MLTLMCAVCLCVQEEGYEDRVLAHLPRLRVLDGADVVEYAMASVLFL